MTTGQMFFYSGVALLVLTILTAIIFYIKRPEYTPENGTYNGRGEGGAQKLRNGYPTERMTKRGEDGPPAPRTMRLETQKATEKLQMSPSHKE